MSDQKTPEALNDDDLDFAGGGRKQWSDLASFNQGIHRPSSAPSSGDLTADTETSESGHYTQVVWAKT